MPDPSSPSSTHDANRNDTDPNGLSWPLVERRRTLGFPPFGVERRRAKLESGDLGTRLRPAPLIPFRIAALAVAAVGLVRDFSNHRWYELALLVLMTGVQAYHAGQPVPYENTEAVRTHIVAEQFVNAIVIVLTRSWSSPFVLCLVPTGMLAGFSCGALYSSVVGLTAAVFISTPPIAMNGWRSGSRDAALWCGLLVLVAYTSGLVRRSMLESQRARTSSDLRLAELTEANSLLASLQRLTHLVPASLDPDEVIDGAVTRLEAILPFDHLSLFLVEREGFEVVLTRSRGRRPTDRLRFTQLPSPLRLANTSLRPVLLREMVGQSGIVSGAQSGVYATLRARGHDVGFLAVESDEPARFTEQHAEVLHGVSQTLGVAIDNARLFQGIRTIAADQERTRIARNLHDQIGSSLALVGFELDRALSVSRTGGDVVTIVEQAREHVSAMVSEMRETLYDLRSDVSDTHDLARTVDDFLHRVGRRSQIVVTATIELDPRLETSVERELWQIIREAILNAERHASATAVQVVVGRNGTTVFARVRDNGIGINATAGRADSYGMAGMHERASRMRASLTVGIPADGGAGTEVRFEWEEPSPDRDNSLSEEGRTQ